MQRCHMRLCPVGPEEISVMPDASVAELPITGPEYHLFRSGRNSAVRMTKSQNH